MKEAARLSLSSAMHPWRNLALEEYLLRQVKPDQVRLFLWRNEQTVVIRSRGRARRSWIEQENQRARMREYI